MPSSDYLQISGASATAATQPADLPVTQEASFALELEAIQAEAMGWIPLNHGAYLHQGAPSNSDMVIEVVGIPDIRLFEMNVVLLV